MAGWREHTRIAPMTMTAALLSSSGALRPLCATTRRSSRRRLVCVVVSASGMSVADLARPCLPSHGRSHHQQWTELAQISANDNSKGKGKTGTSRGGKKGTVATPSKGSQPTPEPGMGEVITAGLTFALIVGGGLFAFPEMAKAIGVLPTDEPRDPPVDPPSSPPRSSSRNDRLYVPYADAKDEMAAAAADAEALWKTRPKPSGSGSLAEKNEPEKLEETIDVTKESKTKDVVAEEAEVVAEEAVVMQTVDSPNVNSALGDLISSPLFYVTFGVAGSVALIQALEAAGVENAEFALSALPIVLLTAISKTTFGESLQKNIEDQRPALEAEKARAELERSAARGKMDGHYGPNRRKFLPQSFGYTFPSHLDGTMCGDVGFDPLGLAAEKESMARYRELELLHGRWAMLGVVGAAVPEALAKFGGVTLGEPVWWKVGEAKLNSDVQLDYLGMGGFHIAGGSGIAIIAACQAVLMGGPEYARYVGIDSLVPVGVYLPGDKDYPGGAPFDPFKMSDDAATFETQKVMEMKHGRLAMVAMLGCFAQAYATRVGPVENLVDAADRLRAFL